MKKVIEVTKVQIVNRRQRSDRDNLGITASQRRMLICSQLIIVCVERGDIRLEALAGADTLDYLF